MNFLQIKLLFVFIFLFVAVYTDIKLRKIKNTLIIIFVLSGITINIWEEGLNGFFLSLKGISLPVILLLIFFKLKMLGAGDIKLFSGIGAFMGSGFLLETMICSFLTGGVIAAILIIIRKNARQRFGYMFTYLKSCFITFALLPYEYSGDSNDDAKFPFACAVISGVGLKILFNFTI